ncbi:hypothetical protein [Desulfonatronovibrio hydrogenovorans]|uniref:hypothetical protein n=1 Tax=Desulfonatronovibrio hydrogenovorans TaxID=53245 RepID=UPI00068F6DFC|nr:hypothetical protein [Desulfonatronovibrio hydrogenovorans]
MAQHKVKKFPAYNCVFFRLGSCVYEEALNPGFDPKVQCSVLAELEKKFDHLLHQADVFRLTSEQVHTIWASRFGEEISWDSLCTSYMPQAELDDRCRYLFGNSCLGFLPRCLGICSSYSVFKPKKDIES